MLAPFCKNSVILQTGILARINFVLYSWIWSSNSTECDINFSNFLSSARLVALSYELYFECLLAPLSWELYLPADWVLFEWVAATGLPIYYLY